MNRIVSLAFACLIFLSTQLTNAGEIALKLDWNQVQLDRPFPVTGGVPFPRGELKDTKTVALQINDTSVPLQTKILATWPDGSVKWLLLDFKAPTSAAAAKLVWGDTAKPAEVKESIKTESTDKMVKVDTGAVSFVVRADGNGFIDELSYKGKPLFANDPSRRLNVMDALHVEKPANYHPMNRLLENATADPSTVVVKSVKLETAGPLHAVVLIDGVYRYKLMGQTITGTDVKGDCPFRIRIHAHAGESLLKIEHFFYYEGDGDHDFVSSLSLRLPVAAGGTVRFVDAAGAQAASGPLAGLYQQDADSFQVWNSTGASPSVVRTGSRFNGVLDVKQGEIGVAVGVKDFWQNASKSLHADTKLGQVRINLWAPEAPPLDFRRHAREWSVGEAGTPNDPQGIVPRPFEENRPNSRLASKGVGKSHFVMIFPHDASTPDAQVLATYQLFNQRPLVWAEPKHYASTFALGKYREYIPGKDEVIENALSAPVDFWRFSQERFRWYGFWLYGNVNQSFNQFDMNGRWTNDFGRWGWANGDSVGRLGYALMLQAVRKCQREDLEFAEKYLYAIHDVCSTHTPAYPRHYETNFTYIKGAAHRHGAWPWAGTYVGSRGAHPMGAKIYYYLTGEGHARDIMDEMTELALKNPSGGEGDGPLGGNALVFIYQWETTGDDVWRQRVKKEIDDSELLHKAEGGWLVMMSAAFGIHNAMEEYGELTQDNSYRALAVSFADRAMPKQMKSHWTWGGYYRVYAHALNVSSDPQYAAAIKEMLPVYTDKMRSTLMMHFPRDQWPGVTGGPGIIIDANIIRDIPFALYALDQQQAAAPEGKK